MKWLAGLIPYVLWLLAATPTITVQQNQQVMPPTITTQTQSGLDSWIAQSNWPQWTWPTVKRIVMCESGGIVGIATNPPHVGLMQANVNIWGRVPADPISELNQGYEIYLQQGWEAWSCY